MRQLLLGLLGLPLLLHPMFSQEHSHASGRLGTVRFGTSCDTNTEADFNRAVALLHSFEFSRAIAGFNDVLKTDPSCGIAYWGIALSQWSNPFASGAKDKTQFAAGKASADLGRRTGAKTERERAYISAVSALYNDFETTTQRSRLIAYRDAMETVTSKYPDDKEAQIFYALAIAASEDPAKKEPGRFRALYGAARAAQLANQPDLSRKYFIQLLNICEHADHPGRPELIEARKAVSADPASGQ